MRINADLSRRVVVDSDALPWVDSPLPGVRRRMLDREGGEVARATSLVEYAPGSHFDAHTHEAGEEFLVLDGVFSDETGDFEAGLYVRNPPGSRHRPGSAVGCIILVKLRQFDRDDREQVRLDTRTGRWRADETPGVEVLPLFARGDERVALVRWSAGARAARRVEPEGEEIFVLEGELEDEHGRYPRGTWVRNPPGSSHVRSSPGGAKVWVKTGHLTRAALARCEPCPRQRSGNEG